MFIFSNIHNWQNDPAVAQILVFSDRESKQLFDKQFAERIKKDGVESASDAGIGAVYRLRAVKDGNGKYVPVIRAGAHSGLIWEGEPLDDKMKALRSAVFLLHASVFIDPSVPDMVAFHRLVNQTVDLKMQSLKVTESGNYEFEDKTAVEQ